MYNMRENQKTTQRVISDLLKHLEVTNPYLIANIDFAELRNGHAVTIFDDVHNIITN